MAQVNICPSVIVNELFCFLQNSISFVPKLNLVNVGSRGVARISVGGYKYCLIVVYEISFLRKLSRVMHICITHDNLRKTCKSKNVALNQDHCNFSKLAIFTSHNVTLGKTRSFI